MQIATGAFAAIAWCGLSDLLGFHIKLYFLQMSTHQYILRRRAGESKLQIAAGICQSKVAHELIKEACFRYITNLNYIIYLERNFRVPLEKSSFQQKTTFS